MLTEIKKATRALFIMSLLTIFLLVGATPTYAWLKYITISPDGSFSAISCGSSAGPTAIIFDASTGLTYVIGAAHPSHCEGGGGGTGVIVE